MIMQMLSSLHKVWHEQAENKKTQKSSFPKESVENADIRWITREIQLRSPFK